MNILSSYAFFTCINKPTRITPTSSTIIDNIFTNTLNKENNSGVLYYDLSDHLPIFTISSQFKFNCTNKLRKFKYRKESLENINALNQDLVNEEWQDVYIEKNVDKAYENFINKLTYYYNKNIPLIQTKQKRNTKNPWITPGILKSMKTRNKLYKTYIRKSTEENHKKYKQYRNKLTDIIRNSKTALF